VIIWDPATAKEVAKLQAGPSYVRPVAFSADSKSLAAGMGDGNVKLWDTSTWQERATLQGHKDLVFSVTFAPDGGTLASTSKDGTVRLWTMPNAGPARPAVTATRAK
jgi:WD40 repeat protein